MTKRNKNKKTGKKEPKTKRLVKTKKIKTKNLEEGYQSQLRHEIGGKQTGMLSDHAGGPCVDEIETSRATCPLLAREDPRERDG